MKKNRKIICFVLCLVLLLIPGHLIYATEFGSLRDDSSFMKEGEALAPRPGTGNTVSGNDMAGGNNLLELLREDIVALKVPENLDFIMDPYQLCGRGQIYSKEYFFQNSGTQTLRIKLTDIKCKVKENIRAVGAEEDEEDILNSEEKVIRLQVQFGTGDIITVAEEPGEYEFTLEPEQAMMLQMTGSMSENPSPFWETGDVSIFMVYSMEIIES